MTNPSFTARFLGNLGTALRCRETGTRYIIGDISGGAVRDECAAYREGQMIRTGNRATCVNAVESDARWTIRRAT